MLSTSTTLTFSEGEHQISMRAVDRVGNIGSPVNVDVKSMLRNLKASLGVLTNSAQVM